MDGIEMDCVLYFLSFTCQQSFDDICLPRPATVVQRRIPKLIGQIDIRFLFEPLYKSLLPFVYRSQMQNILTLRVGNAQIESFILQYLCDFDLILEVGIGEWVAFERIVIIEHQLVFEGDFVYECADCLLVSFALIVKVVLMMK